MRAVILSLVAVACGKGAGEAPPSAGSGSGSAKPTVPPPPPPIEPTIVAVTSSDHVKFLALAPTGITVQHDVKLPTPADTVSWLDRDHFVAVDSDGVAYLVTGDTVAAYKMPPARAWTAKPGAGETAAKFPTKLTLERTADGVELSSCLTYEAGDDDPCVTWGTVTLGTSLQVGEVTVGTTVADADSADVEIKASTEAPKIAWTDNADGMHQSVALTLGPTNRTWASEEPCPLTDARIRWLSATPPIISFTTTSDCGEGGPNDEEHILRVPTLVDFAPDAPTIVVSPTLWAHSNPDHGWTLLSGERVVGALDGPPLLQPSTTAPVAPVTPTPPSTSGLRLHRGEKLHVPAAEVEWKASGMHATIVDVTYKRARHKLPISKLVVWKPGKRFDIVRTPGACDAFADVHLSKDLLVFRCGSRPVGDEPEGRVEDWLVRWNAAKKAPLRNKHWAGDPAAAEPAWAK